MRNVLDKSCIENKNVHFVFNDFFKKSCHGELMWKSMTEPDRPQMTV